MLGGKMCEGVIILDKENKIVAIVSEELVTVKGDYKYSHILTQKHSARQTILNFLFFIALVIAVFYFFN